MDIQVLYVLGGGALICGGLVGFGLLVSRLLDDEERLDQENRRRAWLDEERRYQNELIERVERAQAAERARIERMASAGPRDLVEIDDVGELYS